jgi:uncharacterized Zn finger protein (UPF0148 family)
VKHRPDGEWCFQCPECGFGSFEVGHLVADGELFCVVCEEERRLVRVDRWEAPADQARLAEALKAA